jgi:hypothetical protein
MSFSRTILWYHSHADTIWPDGTFNYKRNIFISFFIQNGANSAKPSDWYQKYIYEEKKKQKVIYFLNL